MADDENKFFNNAYSFDIIKLQHSDNKTMMAQTTAHNEAKQDSTSGYATVNGLKMYYEIHGTGTPLVLIHGG